MKIIRNKFKSIFIRIATFAWVQMFLTLVLFVLFILPFQRNITIKGMRSKANDVANSVAQVTLNAIVLEDYGFVVEHCLEVIEKSNSLRYIVFTKHDGFSIIHSQNPLGPQSPNLPRYIFSLQKFLNSPLDWQRRNKNTNLRRTETQTH